MITTVTRPLSELDQVNWAHLEHAYGSAEDVPDQLRRIAAGDSEAFESAFGNLWHQGTVYSATAAAVPFLIGMLEAGNTKVLQLLGCVAQGAGYLQVHQSYDVPEKIAELAYQAELNAELQWVSDAHQAVAAGVEIYRTFLKDPDPDVAIWAVHLLAPLQFLEPRVVDWLWVCLQQSESLWGEGGLVVQANCAWALQQVNIIDSEGLKVLQGLMAQTSTDQVAQLAQFMAALAMARLQGIQADAMSAELLLANLKDQDIEEYYIFLNAYHCDLYKDIQEAAFSIYQADIFADAFWEKYQKTGDFDFALYALDLTHPTPQAPLSTLALCILRHMLQEQDWSFLARMLKERHGLPATSEELQILLDGYK